MDFSKAPSITFAWPSLCFILAPLDIPFHTLSGTDPATFDGTNHITLLLL